MQLIIHDLTPLQEKNLLPQTEETRIISDGGDIRSCIGCFGCWVKTPAQCIIRDKYGNMGAQLGHCDELILISRCTYGGFSPFVKNVLDRSISYIHPYFKVKNGEKCTISPAIRAPSPCASIFTAGGNWRTGAGACADAGQRQCGQPVRNG